VNAAQDDMTSGHGLLQCDAGKRQYCCQREYDCCKNGTEIFELPENVPIREITDPPPVPKPRDPSRWQAERRKISTIIGIAVGLGIILILVLLAWGAWYLRRRSRKRKKEESKPQTGASELDATSGAAKETEVRQVEAAELETGDSKVVRGELEGSTVVSPGTVSRSATLSPNGDGVTMVNLVTPEVIEMDGEISMTPRPTPCSPDIKQGGGGAAAATAASHVVSPLLESAEEESEAGERSAVSRMDDEPTRGSDESRLMENASKKNDRLDSLPSKLDERG
jgi:hypothetical protein